MSSFHFDSYEMLTALKNMITPNKQFEWVKDTITSVNLDDDGYIKDLELEKNKNISGDIYLDCSGFSRMLISKVSESSFEDYSEYLPCNRAIATHIDITKEKKYVWTTATAMEAGWHWSIPLQDKIGVGYVYSNKFISDRSAEKEFNNHLGGKHDYLKLRFNPGYHKESFSKNCFAIGIASGFFEPMEATALMTNLKQVIPLMWLIKNDSNPSELYSNDRVKSFRKLYNKNIENMFLSIRDYIFGHYYLSDNNHSSFWKYFNNVKLPNNFSNLIEAWKNLNNDNVDEFWDIFYKGYTLDYDNDEELEQFIIHENSYVSIPRTLSNQWLLGGDKYAFSAFSWIALFMGMNYYPENFKYVDDLLTQPLPHPSNKANIQLI